MTTGNDIPKRLFYVWFGGKSYSNTLLSACVSSWKNTNPQYSIIQMNEKSSLFEKAMQNDFFRICYKKKLWAFASDYFRVITLYEDGGIYLDSDMMLLKPLEAFIGDRCFLGLEQLKQVSFGIAGAPPNNSFIKKLLDFYDTEIMHSPLYTIPSIASHILERDYGFTGFATAEEERIVEYNDITIYPREYFYPYYCNETFSLECITEKTHGIHFWNDSWSATKFWVKNKHISKTNQAIKWFSQWVFQMSVRPRRGRYYIKLFGITFINKRGSEY